MSDARDLRVSDQDRVRAVQEIANLRISDEDRDRAVEEIREHFAAGRLSEDEMDERVQAAVRAQTQGELATIRHDLPNLPVSPAQGKAALAERRTELRRRLLQEAGGATILVGACVAIWAASGANGSFWPIWVALACAVALLRTSWLLYGPAPDFERVEQDLARYRQWNERHDRPLLEARRRRQDARRQRRHERRR